MKRKITLTIATEDTMPEGIYGMLSQYKNGDYLILLNENQSEDGKARSFLHECLHIWHNDLNSGDPVGKIEAERAEELQRILRMDPER